MFDDVDMDAEVLSAAISWMSTATSRSAPIGLADVKVALQTLDRAMDDAGRVDALRLLEEIKNVAAAAQALVAVDFDASQRAAQVAAGVRAERVGCGVTAQVGLARRIAPYEAARYVGNAKILTTELPGCFTRLRAGVVSEWRVLQVARETAWLSREHRAVVDAEIAADLDGLGTRQITTLTKKLAYRLDPHGYMGRLKQAETERHVSLRPVPDCMSRLSTLTTIPQGVAARAALQKEADRLVAAGDERTRSQIMADTLIERVTGQTRAADVPVTVNLIMTDQALFGDGNATGDAGAGSSAGSGAGTDRAGTGIGAAARAGADAGADEPAYLVDGDTIPAAWARRMVLDPSGETEMFLRRLYMCPKTGQLIAMESTARFFPRKQREFLILRDQICRTPWCDAPVRHADHVTPSANGGRTRVADGQGLCEACNHNKQAIGWHQHVDPDGSIITTTPTGHQYRSPQPRPPGSGRGT